MADRRKGDPGAKGSGAQAGWNSSDPSFDDCLSAGRYWFWRGDLEAAGAWWQRARELEPTHPKVVECFLQLERAQRSGAPNPGATFSGSRDISRDLRKIGQNEGPSPKEVKEKTLDSMLGAYQSYDLGQSADLGSGGEWTTDPIPITTDSGSLPNTRTPAPTHNPVRKQNPVQKQKPRAPKPLDVAIDPSDPFAFAAQGESVASGPSELTGSDDSPWDEGPSRTSVVTLRSDQMFDAVAEPTPLPELDRRQFFNRNIVDDQAYMDYMISTGDLSVGNPAPEIVFDAPVEMGVPVSPAERPIKEIVKDATRKFQLHDFAGVLELLEGLPLERPDLESARSLIAHARRGLLKMCESKIGDFERVPYQKMSDQQIIWLNLNHRAGFILSQIDGSVSYEDLVALSGMPRLDTVRILAELITQGVIATRDI